MGAENLAPTRIGSPDCSAHCNSQYWPTVRRICMNLTITLEVLRTHTDLLQWSCHCLKCLWKSSNGCETCCHILLNFFYWYKMMTIEPIPESQEESQVAQWKIWRIQWLRETWYCTNNWCTASKIWQGRLACCRTQLFLHIPTNGIPQILQNFNIRKKQNLLFVYTDEIMVHHIQVVIKKKQAAWPPAGILWPMTFSFGVTLWYANWIDALSQNHRQGPKICPQ